MKLGLIFGSAAFGLVLGTSIAIASSGPSKASTADVVPVPPVEVPVSIELPQDTGTYTMPTMTVVGHPARAAKAAPRPRTWVCGEAHLMEQGPIGRHVRDCEWK